MSVTTTVATPQWIDSGVLLVRIVVIFVLQVSSPGA
jgi:hypothetical protein